MIQNPAFYVLIQKKESILDRVQRNTKLATFFAIFIIFSAGRWIHLFILSKYTLVFSIQQAIIIGLPVSTIFVFLADLVFAKGLIRKKIFFIELLSLFVILLLLINSIILKNHLSHSLLYNLEIFILSIFSFSILLADFLINKNNDDFTVNKNDKLPDTYLERHPIKTFFETIFRLFPYPEPIGLYEIGNPDENSPVFVTGNFELTIRRVVRHLKGIDSRILVCDSRGINIWCSSLAGHFSTEKILNAINITRLKEKIGHNKLILPQLCASNISTKRIKEETGFECEFGPVNIKNIVEYFKNPGNREIRKVTFNAYERAEMAAGTLIIPALFTIMIFNFIDPMKLIYILPAIYILSFLNALVFPYRFIRDIRLWSLFYGGCIFGAFYLVFTVILNTGIMSYSIAISLAAAYLVNEFEGWSPLVKFEVFSSYKIPQITIDETKCIGCLKCIKVCPKNVFNLENRKSTVVRLSECISCKSCFTQCPVDAIEHSATSPG